MREHPTLLASHRREVEVRMSGKRPLATSRRLGG
jgi:hypothetical protein